MDTSNKARARHEAHSDRTVDALANESVRERCKRLYNVTGAPTYLLAYDRIVELEQKLGSIEAYQYRRREFDGGDLRG